VTPYYTDDAVTLYHGDCLEVLRDLPDASIDSGSGARADSEAEKHTKKTSHATLSWAEPEKEKA